MSPFDEKALPRRRLRFEPLVAVLVIAGLLCGPAQALDAATPGVDGDDVTRELIELLAQSGAVKPSDAARLIEKLRTQIAARRVAATAAVSGAPGWGTPAGGAASATSPGGAVDARGGVHVTYVPESEKKRIRDEIKREVIAEAKAENWAQPNTFPEWVSRIKLEGDLRLRAEADSFDHDNAPFINFQAINAGSPYNIAPQSTAQPPYLNTTEGRRLLRVRARLGLAADLGEGLAANLRLATGNTTNPVSTNQTLGNDFNKLSLTLDRAYLQYQNADGLAAWAGRLPNPWQFTPLVWDEDIAFDGAAVRFKPALADDWRPYATLGGFSVYNTAFDFPSNSVAKNSSRDKWLLAAQVGTTWQLAARHSLDASLAYYHYLKLEGQTSLPCLATSTSDSCSTDPSRPGFVQKGNTLYPIRDLLVDSSQTSPPQYQYFGLATRFHLLDLNAAYDWALGDGLHVGVNADVVRNLAYKSAHVRDRGPVNNFDAGGDYDGGGNGYLVNARFGTPVLGARGDWNVALGYRRLESDAVVDGFTDSDFHLGGTNAKGYTLQANLGLARNAWLSLRWFSATEVSGPPLSIDVLHVDLNAKF